MTDETLIRQFGLMLRELVDRGCLMASVELSGGTTATYRAGVLAIREQGDDQRVHVRNFTSEWLDEHGLEVAK